MGPLLSGSLFSLVSEVRPKGEAIAFGTFGGIALLGFLCSFGITGSNLEAEGWDEGNEEGSEDEEASDSSSTDAVDRITLESNAEGRSGPEYQKSKSPGSVEN